MTKGDILIENVVIDHIKPVEAKLKEAGVNVVEEMDGLRVKSTAPFHSIDIKTLPYPGFPTDMQAQMMAFMTMKARNQIITETVFENRFMHVSELKRLGANIKIEGRSAVVEGVERLTGTEVRATDLRAGAALVLAGLCAEGDTHVLDIYHIDRGYEHFEDKLKTLGAVIYRVE